MAWTRMQFGAATLRLVLALALLLALVMLSAAATAQSTFPGEVQSVDDSGGAPPETPGSVPLERGPAPVTSVPLPGLPGLPALPGLAAPRATAPVEEVAAEETPAAPDTPALDPAAVDTLLEVLQDDAARSALISSLEAARDGAPAPDAGAADPEPDAGQPAAQNDPPPTLASQAIALVRSLIGGAIGDIRDFGLRLARVPNTLDLALRSLEADVVAGTLRDVAWLAFGFYGVLVILRLIAWPLRRRAGRYAAEGGWPRRLGLRLTATVFDALAVPLSTILAILLLSAGTIESIALSPAETSFASAFFAVEMSRAAGRFLLSPHTPSLRIVALPDGAARSLWRLTVVLIYLLGYGQLLIVPIVDETLSVFAARAVSSLLGVITVLVSLVYVLIHRRAVADWLHPGEGVGTVGSTVSWFSDRWHWPVLAYLAYVGAVVATRPGNVLLPLMGATAQIIATLAAGLVVTSGITWMLSQRVRVPVSLAQKLPLLELRLNQMVPALLIVVRALIVLAVLGAILSITGIVNVDRIMVAVFGEQAQSRIVSVMLIGLVFGAIWLGVSSWVDYRVNPFVGSVPTPREITLLALMRNAVTIGLVVVAVLMSLSQLGVNIGPLLASAGVLGLAISFGAQRMVEDIITGIFIQLENAMNVGDIVDVGGTVGTVERLTVRSVTLRDLSGVVHLIPFSSAAKIANYMRDYAYHVADMGVAYREDVDDVRQAMHDGFDMLRTDEEVGPFVIGDLEWFGLNSFGDSALVVRARIKTVPGQQWAVGRAYNAILKRLFDERAIEIPFPHQTVYFGEDKVGSAPALHVALSEPARKGADAERPEVSEERGSNRSDEVQGVDMPDADGD